MTAAVTDEEQTYTTMQVVELTGATYKQIDWWSRSGRLSPTIPAHGSGSQRRFSADDLRTVRAMVALLGEGFTLDAAFRIATQLAENGRYFTRLVEAYELAVVVIGDAP